MDLSKSWLNTSRIPKRDTETSASGSRSEFDRDFGRVLHSSSFRRLQGKTQVWGIRESDYFRTRLTHSLEAGQIGGAIAKAYDIPELLVMAACFAHDIGHPPFGHDGAETLDTFAQRTSGGKISFDDNAQTFRVLVRRESMFSSESGMSLTAAALDGTLKYKRLAEPCVHKAGYYEDDKHFYDQVVSATTTGHKRSPIVMFVELADDIAYACHDLDDALRAGFVTLDAIRHVQSDNELVSSDAGRTVLDLVISMLEPSHTSAERDNEAYRVASKQIKSKLVDRFITQAIEARDHILPRMLALDYDKDLKQNLFLNTIEGLEQELKALKAITQTYVIEDPNVQGMRFAGTELLREYLERYEDIIVHGPRIGKPSWLSLPRVVRQRLLDGGDLPQRLRVMLDYVAGMTDQYFVEQATVFHDLGRGHAVTVRR